MSRAAGRSRVIDVLDVRQGRVHASQTLVTPIAPDQEAAVAARLAALDARQLIGRYGAFIGHWTRGLVRTRLDGDGLRLFLTAHGPCLLALSLREPEAGGRGQARVRATLSITGGLAAVGAAGDGVLDLRLDLGHGASPTGVALEATVLVEHYAPRLLALPLPDALRRLVYSTTQARLHRAITGAFVEDLVATLVP